MYICHEKYNRNFLTGVGLPYAVGPYSFLHPHHSIATYSGPIPSHRVTLPSAPHMQMYHPYPHHPGHPQHPPHHPPSAAPPPPPGPYYTSQPPPPTSGTRHLYTMQQPLPVKSPLKPNNNINFRLNSISIYFLNIFSYIFFVLFLLRIFCLGVYKKYNIYIF